MGSYFLRMASLALSSFALIARLSELLPPFAEPVADVDIIVMESLPRLMPPALLLPDDLVEALSATSSSRVVPEDEPVVPLPFSWCWRDALRRVSTPPEDDAIE